MGVSNHWTGEWTGMVGWIMELTIPHCFFHSVRPEKSLLLQLQARVLLN